MKTNCNLLYFLKKPKNYVNGHPCFIYLRITVDGIRVEFSSGRGIEPERWNAKAGKAIGTKEETKTLNAYLERLKTDVSAVHTQLIAEGAEITAERVKNRYLGKDEAISTHTVLEAIRDHNQRMGALIGRDYAKGTLGRFEVLERHVTGFIAHRYKKEDLDVRKIDRAFIADFDFYLRNEKKNANNTAVKYLKNFGKVVRICVDNKWIDSDPFAGYRFKSKPVKRDYLTADELQRIASRTFATDRLAQVRDFFLFSCYTGLSYVDVKNLRPSDIVLGVDGGRWIDIHRQKSDIRVPVPLLPVAETILDRYKEHPASVEKDLCLPISSNQKMNEYLVEVAELAGVKKTLGNRIAKRTFATTVTLSNGVPIESVSKMLGHTNLRTTQLYAHLLDEKIAHDMAPLKVLFAGTASAVDAMTDRNLQAILQLVHSEVSDREILTVIRALREKLKIAV
ncbi:site-specific integrase [Sphingobacterium sp. HMSC13C05]|uniref:site-specific integrase n=1 Tax=Sphingobacterium sp. HMSC13C05 TaxID=1581095 RepID=UPI0008A5D585|nr:site-specific integrase [Sphingobacterium sp. HMSC13C05]